METAIRDEIAHRVVLAVAVLVVDVEVLLHSAAGELAAVLVPVQDEPAEATPLLRGAAPAGEVWVRPPLPLELCVAGLAASVVDRVLRASAAVHAETGSLDLRHGHIMTETPAVTGGGLR
jgi:hypothetical protein